MMLSATVAQAQNANYTAGDLVLYFQNPGGTTGSDQTLYVNLGNTATAFRDATSNLLNISNIGNDLTAAFGANWFEQDTLYFGLAGVWGSSNISNSLQNGDPSRTIYVSRSRNGVGAAGEADSAAWTVASDGFMTTGSNNMVSQNNVLETQYTTAVAQSPTGTSNIDNQNPFLAPGVQNTAFGAFAGGVQQAFSTGSFGILGAAGDVEGALDLYRIQAKNNISGQSGLGDPVRTGDYLGTVTIDSTGQVSFLAAVPEPSTFALLGLGVVAAFGFVHFRRRRLQS